MQDGSPVHHGGGVSPSGEEVKPVVKPGSFLGRSNGLDAPVKSTSDFHRREQWETCQEKQQFPDGRFRVRNMLLAEKKARGSACGANGHVMSNVNLSSTAITCKKTDEVGQQVSLFRERCEGFFCRNLLHNTSASISFWLVHSCIGMYAISML